MPQQSRSDIITKDDAARIIKVSRRRVDQFCKDGRLGKIIGRSQAGHVRVIITRGQALDFAGEERRAGRPATAGEKS